MTSRDLPETIFALATGFGTAAIAIIRISGSRTRSVLSDILSTALPPPRRSSLRVLRDPSSGNRLDQAVVLWLPGPQTFTGEDQAELHIHGGPAVKAAVLRALSDRPGCRAAEPGEFTRRAFLNGRMDLTEVEGVADLVAAETESQRRQALRQVEGALGAEIASWRERLVEALASSEAGLDFSDEEDVPADVASGLASGLATLRDEIAAALSTADRGERIRDGCTVVIAGPPNAGKSTLLNAIARRDVALVSAVPGTTRDAIELRCDLGGLPVTFVDTAGLRQSADALEQAGMARTEERLATADLALWLTPLDGPAVEPYPSAGAAILVATKLDLPASSGEASTGAEVALSARTGEGLDRLLELIRTRLSHSVGAGDAVITRERHRVALQEVVASLDRATVAGQSGAPELLAEDLRLALRALGRLTGAVDVEEILDRIFASFCIGK